jgi:hypothetical protein
MLEANPLVPMIEPLGALAKEYSTAGSEGVSKISKSPDSIVPV